MFRTNRGVEGLLGTTAADLRRDTGLATAMSGLRNAVAQLSAMRAGVSLGESLGGERAESVPLYANIKQVAVRHAARSGGLRPRRGQRSARRISRVQVRSVRRGLAPPSSPGRILDEAALGLARVKAARGRHRPGLAPAGGLPQPIRGGYGAADSGGAAEVGRRLVRGTCAADRGRGGSGADSALRSRCRWRAASPATAPTSSTKLLDSEAVSIIMPDVKYCGGVGEAVKAGRSAVARGKGFSIHCPSGPISLLASAHATLAVGGAMHLEHAVYEADWRADLVLPTERVEDGRIWLPPDAPGLGATLNWELVRRFGRVWEP